MRWLRLAFLFVAAFFSAIARGDIYQWEYIDPVHPELGKQQSSTFAPDGAGRMAVPGADLSSLDLTKAWLHELDLTQANFNAAMLTGADLSGTNLSDASFWSSTLTEANITCADVRGANFFGAGILAEQLYSTASYRASDLSGIELSSNNLSGWDFADQDLHGAIFNFATLRDADFKNAYIRGAQLAGTTTKGLVASQLYSTASYQAGDLSGVSFGKWSSGYFPEPGNDLTGWSFAGQDLTGARLDDTILDNGNFKEAIVIGTDFRGTTENGFTAAQLYSTASYQAGDLSQIILGDNDLSGWDLSGQDLRVAWFGNSFYGHPAAKLDDTDLSGANLSGAWFGQAWPVIGMKADLSNADARGAKELETDSAVTRNLVFPDGHVEGLAVVADEAFRLWDLDPTLILTVPAFGLSTDNPIGDIPIRVEEGMSIDPAGTLRAVFEDDQWGSTIRFVPGIPVALAGTLELLFAEDVNPATLVGTTYQLFDWTGIAPTGQFGLILTQNGLRWSTNNLYTTGEVTLIGAVPEPSTWILVALFLLLMAGNNSKLRTQRGM